MTPLHPVSMLVIEDDEPVRSTLVDILELNASSAAAANGTADLASARRDRPALIIADGNMPGLTGVELLATVRGEEALRAIPAACRSRFGSFAMINTPPPHHSASAFTTAALPASRGTSCTTMRWVAPAPTATSKPTMRVPGFGASVAAGGGSVG